ncbi:MAG TPA: hypothetical protein PKM25_16635 [Candidatus Ozemobacteraceae bacterium]|nr:hypothetical protein [Candidatus Ozemobacteraceae bacterium]
MLRQLWALVALKWTLLRHTWHAGKWISLALVIGMSAGAIVLSLTAAAGLYFLGVTAAKTQSPAIRLLLLDIPAAVYLFFWVWGLLMEVQRNDLIDLRKLLFFEQIEIQRHNAASESRSGPIDIDVPQSGPHRSDIPLQRRHLSEARIGLRNLQREQIRVILRPEKRAGS